jgi:hypothetical protein
LLIRVLASVLLVIAVVHQLAAEEPAGGGEEAKRKALWEAFKKAKPKEIEKIDAYGENPSLTSICFSAGGQMYLFSTKAGKVEPLVFMKALPKINRITFREDKNLDKGGSATGWFVLWADGEVEMNFLADK